MINKTEFNPKIINEELYIRWGKVYGRSHRHAEFLSCVKINPDNPNHIIVVGYNSERWSAPLF